MLVVAIEWCWYVVNLTTRVYLAVTAEAFLSIKTFLRAWVAERVATGNHHCQRMFWLIAYGAAPVPMWHTPLHLVQVRCTFLEWHPRYHLRAEPSSNFLVRRLYIVVPILDSALQLCPHQQHVFFQSMVLRTCVMVVIIVGCKFVAAVHIAFCNTPTSPISAPKKNFRFGCLPRLLVQLSLGIEEH